MRRLLLILVPLTIILAAAIWRAQGPAPASAGAPEREFSAGRAWTILEDLQSDASPHPIGSEANGRMRARIERRFHELGYTTVVQRTFACNAGAVCGAVENIIATDGRAGSLDQVLVVGHYDSVPAGPGASDDGTAVAAILEIARAVRGESMRNRIGFLITDGEEAGLLGAEGFVTDERLSKNVAAVINMESRGTWGPSNMFETSVGNRWLIRHLAHAFPRPQASSLFFAIYNLLPNDSDVTVFKRAGKAAVNFGAIRGVNWYHTPLDDLAHASPRTLQHHGENALGALRALANADLAVRSSTDATYFDVLGFVLVWWPQTWTLIIAVASLLLLVAAVRKVQPRAMTLGVLATLVTILLSAVGGSGVAAIARIGSADANFVARPIASVAAMWLAGLASALCACALFNRRDDERAMLFGIAIVWHVIGIALAIVLPGAAFLFVVPAVAVTCCALAGARSEAVAAVASATGAVLIFPLGLTLYDALGGRLMVAIAVLIGMLATLAAPLFARARNGLAVAFLAIASAVVAMMQPAFDAERPRHIPLYYVDDASLPQPVWTTGVLTSPLAGAAKFARAETRVTPWSADALWAAPAPGAGLPRVALNATRAGDVVRVTVRSGRAANRLSLLFRGGTVLRVNGVTPPPRPPRFRERAPAGWQRAAANGVPEMVVEIRARGPVQAVASDATWGLPPAGAPLLRARQQSIATTVHDGDVTITRARATF